MAAGLGFKTFVTGEVLTAADTNGYLMQGINVFADATARDAAITSPQEGQFAYLKDTNVTTYYTGSAWANVDTTGMTNPMTTTGDVIYSSSGSTPARLGIGTAGQVLKVNSGATAPEWGAAGGASFVGCSLYKSGTQSTSNGVWTAITFDSELFDTDAFHDNVTNNSRITIPAGKNGKYQINGSIMWVASGTGSRLIKMQKNGADILYGNWGTNAGASDPSSKQISGILDLVATDYLELNGYHSHSTSLNVDSTSPKTFFQITYLGA